MNKKNIVINKGEVERKKGKYTPRLINDGKVLDTIFEEMGGTNDSSCFDGKIIIPEGVVAVTEKFFIDLSYYYSLDKRITEVIFPKTLMFIENSSFKKISSYPILDFSNCINLIKVGKRAVFKDQSFTTIKIPTLRNEYIWFEKCYIKELIIKKNVDFTTSIGENFSVEKCIIDDGIKFLKNLATNGNSSITDIELPLSINSFDLTSISFGSSPYGYYKAMWIKEENGIKKYYCREQEFKIGERPEKIKNLTICASGYHYCTNIRDILHYYQSVYGEDFVVVEIEPEVIVNTVFIGTDSKTVTNTFLPKKVLSKEEFITLFNAK